MEGVQYITVGDSFSSVGDSFSTVEVAQYSGGCFSAVEVVQ